MSIENQTPNLNESQQEQGEILSPTLDGFLEALQQEGVNTLSAEIIKNSLMKLVLL